MTTPIHHPFLNVPGQVDRFQLLEDGRQAYVSWGASQPDKGHYAGEVCRKNGDVAVFLGTEENKDYFMHIMGGEIPEGVSAIDLDEQEYVYDADEEFSDVDFEGGSNNNAVKKSSQFDRFALSV